MNLRAAVPVDNPVDRIFAYHRKAERQLAALGRLPGHLEIFGVDAEASVVAGAALNCFGAAMLLHQQDEERDLLPLLERRIAHPVELERFRQLRVRIQGDHRSLEEAWRELRRPLAAIAEGLRRDLPEGPLRYFRAISALHISAEEATLHVLAHRHLDASDRAALTQRMDARRTATNPSSR